MEDEPGGKPPLDMVERVARALFACEYRRQSGWTFDQELRDPDLRTYWMTSARAAIEAMKIPTEAMEDAFYAKSDEQSPHAAGIIWEAMIEAALNPQAPERGGS